MEWLFVSPGMECALSFLPVHRGGGVSCSSRVPAPEPSAPQHFLTPGAKPQPVLQTFGAPAEAGKDPLLSPGITASSEQGQAGIPFHTSTDWGASPPSGGALMEGSPLPGLGCISSASSLQGPKADSISEVLVAGQEGGPGGPHCPSMDPGDPRGRGRAAPKPSPPLASLPAFPRLRGAVAQRSTAARDLDSPPPNPSLLPTELPQHPSSAEPDPSVPAKRGCDGLRGWPWLGVRAETLFRGKMRHLYSPRPPNYCLCFPNCSLPF